MSKQKILVLGITGLIGSRIGQLLKEEFAIIAPPHSHLDLTNRRKVQQNIFDVGPSQIVYAAGLTKVDMAQTHPKETFLINTEAVEHVCQKALRLGIPVHYISTDAVFDGKQSDRPYAEDDNPNPVSVYGKSKLAGEEVVLGASGKNSVVRTIMVYCSFFPNKKDFARLAYEALKNQERFEGIVDQVINPTFVDDLVWAIAAILAARASGIYHVAACDYTTNYGFVKKIAKAFGFKNSLITKVKFDDFFGDKPAPRTKYCWLDTSKFRREFGPKILQTLDGAILRFRKQIEKLETEPTGL